MKIALIEPFFTGSHAAWAHGYAQHTRHAVEIFHLPGNFWKWRMHGGAVTLAPRFLRSDPGPDMILATDMLDLTTFLALTRHKSASLPVALYFHENQMCYPWSPTDRDYAQHRDYHYGFINYASALAADLVAFNSQYHADAFFDALPRFLKRFPDHQEADTVAAIRGKSGVLPVGVDFQRFSALEGRFDRVKGADQAPLLLWNHRWEYDKNPAEFFQALDGLIARGLDFQVAILGEKCGQQAPIFEAARAKLGRRVAHYGYADDFEQYAQWLYRADLVPATSRQDFFGISLAEAVYCGCYPLLPKRLSYPELISSDAHPEVFYTDFQELVEKLAQAVQTIAAIRTQSFRSCVESYAWPLMAARYDAAFESLCLGQSV